MNDNQFHMFAVRIVEDKDARGRPIKIRDTKILARDEDGVRKYVLSETPYAREIFIQRA